MASCSRLLRGVSQTLSICGRRQLPAVGARFARGLQVSAVHQKKSRTEASAVSELFNVLEKEMEQEQEQVSDEPAALSGWQKPVVEDGTVTLEKTTGDVTLTVEIDINSMTEMDDAADDAEEMESEEPPVPQFYPEFSVTVKNSTNPGQVFQADMSFEPPMEGDDVSVALERVRMCPPGTKDRNIYLCDATNLDPDVYDNIIKYLQSLGLTSHFVDYIIDLSRHYEHREYICFLKGFSAFIKPSK